MKRLFVITLLALSANVHGAIEVSRPEDATGIAVVAIHSARLDSSDYETDVRFAAMGYDAKARMRLVVVDPRSMFDNNQKPRFALRMYDRYGAKVSETPIGVDDVKLIQEAFATLPKDRKGGKAECPINIHYTVGAAANMGVITKIEYTCDRFAEGHTPNRAG